MSERKSRIKAIVDGSEVNPIPGSKYTFRIGEVAVMDPVRSGAPLFM